MVRLNISVGVSEANQCSKFDMKIGHFTYRFFMIIR